MYLTRGETQPAHQWSGQSYIAAENHDRTEQERCSIHSQAYFGWSRWGGVNCSSSDFMSRDLR